MEKEKFYSITLTIRNCSGDRLSETIKKLDQAYDSLLDLAEDNPYITSFFSSLEIAHLRNIDPDLEFHPHLHCTCAVYSNYFTSEHYVSPQSLGKLWQQALGVDYEPAIDIREIDIDEFNHYASSGADLDVYR